MQALSVFLHTVFCPELLKKYLVQSSLNARHSFSTLFPGRKVTDLTVAKRKLAFDGTAHAYERAYAQQASGH